MDNGVKIDTSSTPADVVTNSIREMYNLDSEIHQVRKGGGGSFI